MKERELLPEALKECSISDEEIIVPYDEALKLLDFFRESGYAALGYEMLRVSHIEQTEIRTFVSYFPDSIVWEEFVEDAYVQVKKNLERDYQELLFSDEGIDDVYFLMTFVNQQEFEDYYYDYVVAD